MDCGDGQRGLHPCTEGLWTGNGSRGQSSGHVLDLQQSGGATRHSVGCFLAVVRGIPVLLSSRYGFHLRGNVNTTPCGHCATCRGWYSSSSPATITCTIFSQCFRVFNEDYMIFSWYLHVRTAEAMALDPPTFPAEKRSLGEDQTGHSWRKLGAYVRICSQQWMTAVKFLCKMQPLLLRVLHEDTS